MSTDKARRRTVTCASCGENKPHRGHGYCGTCWTRWVYWDRPVEGPPAPGATPPKSPTRKPTPVPDECTHGHPLDDTSLGHDSRGARVCLTCRRGQYRAYSRRQFDQRHEGHDVIPTVDGRRYCRTCVRGDHDVDEIAVERAVSGDGPESLRTAEREAAIVQLRSYGLTYELIAERVGCALRTAWWTCDRLGVTEVNDARAWVENWGMAA